MSLRGSVVVQDAGFVSYSELVLLRWGQEDVCVTELGMLRIFSQVVVGTSRLDTIKQIGHDPTGMFAMVAVEAKSQRGHTPLWLDRFFRAARVRRGFNHRNPSATGGNVCPVSDAVIKISSSEGMGESLRLRSTFLHYEV